MSSNSIPFIDVQIPLDNSIFDVQNLNNSLGNNMAFGKILQSIRPKWNMARVQIEVFTMGTTNKIVCVSHVDGNDENVKLVFRIYGARSERVIDRFTELAILERLASAGIAAAIHAKFGNGLVCGFQPGQCLSLQSVRDPKVAEKIAKTMVQMHKVPLKSVELDKPIFAIKAMEWLDKMPSKFDDERIQVEFDQYFQGLDLVGQLQRLLDVLNNFQSSVVLAHNDLNIYNTLYDAKSDNVHFIDFEYAGPNYQLFDIGNHFCEYAGLENPDFEKDSSTEEEKRHFLSRYFLHYQGRELASDELKNLLGQVPFFEAASHLFWAIWAIYQAQFSTILVDYMSYAFCRHRQFARLMAQLQF